MILPQDRKDHDGEIVFDIDYGFGIFHFPSSIHGFGAPNSEDDISILGNEILYESLEETFDEFAKQVSKRSSSYLKFPVVVLKKESKI